jgi:hypothetical protein
MKTKKIKSKRGGARKGAGRPKLNEPRFILSMSLDNSYADKFRKMAKDNNISQPKMFRLLLDQYHES